MAQQKSFLILVVVLLCASICFGKYSGGTGEPNDPYIIATAEDMNAIGANSADWNKHFLLIADINLADYTGTQFNIIGNSTTPFTGVFDGNNHKIWNFTWDSNGVSYIGLFGKVGSSGQIKNLGMANVDINAVNGQYVGGLAGENYGTISACYSTGNILGTRAYVGGLVGANNLALIDKCWAVVRVEGTNVLGGLVGINGINGMSCTISRCWSESTVVGNQTLGGMVGANYAVVSESYAVGNVDGNYRLGGLIGFNNIGQVSHCYSATHVLGNSHAGGLVGDNLAGTVSSSFWDVNSSGQTTSDGGEGKTTAQMQTKSTFTNASWDFVTVWDICEGVDYPKLIWQWKDYQEWLAVDKPLCWCCPRQCHGDADKTSEYIKGKGYYHVHFKDLSVLLTAWNIKEPPDGPGIAWPDPNICADFDHDAEYIENKGYYRVHFSDLNILLKNWNVRQPPQGPGIEPNCLDCP